MIFWEFPTNNNCCVMNRHQFKYNDFIFNSSERKSVVVIPYGTLKLFPDFKVIRISDIAEHATEARIMPDYTFLCTYL